MTKYDTGDYNHLHLMASIASLTLQQQCHLTQNTSKSHFNLNEPLPSHVMVIIMIHAHNEMMNHISLFFFVKSTQW